MKVRKRTITRKEDVGRRQMMVAGAMSVLFAVLTLYVLLHLGIGLQEVPWTFLALSAVLALAIGCFWGAKSAASGAGVGMLAGVWIFIELIGIAFAVFLEVLVGLIAGLFAIFN